MCFGREVSFGFCLFFVCLFFDDTLNLYGLFFGIRHLLWYEHIEGGFWFDRLNTFDDVKMVLFVAEHTFYFVVINAFYVCDGNVKQTKMGGNIFAFELVDIMYITI